jgi:hypothetical protein
LVLAVVSHQDGKDRQKVKESHAYKPKKSEIMSWIQQIDLCATTANFAGFRYQKHLSSTTTKQAQNGGIHRFVLSSALGASRRMRPKLAPEKKNCFRGCKANPSPHVSAMDFYLKEH